MKKFILSVLFATSLFTGYSQIYYPSVIERPYTGMSKLMNDNPYMVQQVKDSFGDWLNSYKYFWEPAALSGYKKHNGQFSWTNNEWHEVYSISDSFVLNTNRLVSVAIEKTIYDYPGFSNKEKNKYTYTYNADKTVNTIKADRAASLTSNNYSPDNFFKIFYDATGKRTHDSTYYYQGGQRQYTRYQYNTSNQLVAQYGVNAVTGDTTYRTFYSYQDGLLKTLYSEGFDQSTDDWSVQNADSMEISNGKVTNRITYGLYIDNGIISIRPGSNEAYTYNTDGSLHTILTKRWDGAAWYDFTRLEMLYSNGKPLLAPVYYAIEGGFETEHSMRYVFNFLSGVNELKQTAAINNIYPNPASEQLNVTLNNTNDATFFVFDLAGKLVEQGNTTADKLTIDLHDYTNGVYYLNIRSAEETSTRKFIVAK